MVVLVVRSLALLLPFKGGAHPTRTVPGGTMLSIACSCLLASLVRLYARVPIVWNIVCAKWHTVCVLRHTVKHLASSCLLATAWLGNCLPLLSGAACWDIYTIGSEGNTVNGDDHCYRTS